MLRKALTLPTERSTSEAMQDLARRWNSETGHLVLLAPAAILEVLWAHAWVVWAHGRDYFDWTAPPLSLAGAVLLGVAAALVSRAALERDWSLERARLMILGGMAALLIAVVRLGQGGGYALWDMGWFGYAAANIPTVVAGFAFGAYLVLRGISVGRESPAFDDLYRRFLFGLAALVLLVVVSTLTAPADSEGTGASLGIYVLAHFTIGLAGLALVHLNSVRENASHRGIDVSLLSRRWLPLVLGVVVGLGGAAVAFASVFSFELAALLLRPISLLADLLLLAFMYGVVYPMAYAVAGLFYLLRLLVNLIRTGEPPAPFEPPAGPPDTSREIEEAAGLPPGLLLALKWGLTILVTLVVLWVLSRAIARYRKGQSDEFEETQESLWTWEGFKADVRNFLLRLLWRFTRRRAPPIPAAVPPPSVSDTEAQDRLFTVREIYQGLLWEGRQAGMGRRDDETPYEYSERLSGQISAGPPAISTISYAFAAERYGSVETPREELDALNALWRRFMRLLHGAQDQTPGAASEHGEHQTRGP